MNKTENINVRIEPKLKKEAEETLNDLGMNMADAITIFLKQVVMTESIPFAIKKPRYYNKETIEAMNDVKQEKNLSKDYTNLDEMWKDIED